MNKQKSLITASYYASFVAMGISMASLGPTLTGLAQHTQADLGAIGILFTARSLGSLVGSVWGGRIFDRMRGNGVMALSVVGMVLLTALTPLVPLLWLLTAVLFLTGAVQGILNIGGNALLVWMHDGNVGPFMNGLHFFYGVGTFITPVIVAQFVAREGGLFWTYMLLALLMLPTAVMAFLPSPAAPVSMGQETGRKQNTLLITLIAMIFCFNAGAVQTFGGWIFTYVTRMGLTNDTDAAYLTSVFWGALTLGRLVAIPLAMRYKPSTLLRADFLGALVSLLAMCLWPHSLAAVVITSAGLGFTMASIYPTLMSFSGQLMPISGKVTGLFSVGTSIGAMILPWVIGQFFESSGPQSMAVVLLVDVLLALVVLFDLIRRTTTTQRPAHLPQENSIQRSEP